MIGLPIDTQTAHNLPTTLSHFVGRERELEEVKNLHSVHRLLTLTGPSGCGKTRLALEAARSMLSGYPHGVWLVDFSLINDPQQVFLVLGQSLNVTAQGKQPLESVVLDTLRHRRLLLILDNCEHVVLEASRAAAVILASAQAVKVIATSQVPLGVPGEVEWIVPSLSMPADGQETSDFNRLRQYAAPLLFTQRAAEVQPGFTLNEANISIILEICLHLDGIPLALELAAARVKMLSLAEIHARLDDRFTLLVNARRAASRHQTLQAAIDWSYGLLTAQQQNLLNRLGIFHGSWTLEAVEAVCSGALCASSGIPVDGILQLLGELVDRSLVKVVHPTQAGDSPSAITHYRLLESIRIYALAQLSPEEQAQMRDYHLTWYAHLAQQADSHMLAAEQIYWIAQLENDLPNLLAAIEWSAQSPDGNNRLFQGLQLTSAIGWYSLGRSSGDLVHRWLEKILAQAGEKEDLLWVTARAYAQYQMARYYWLIGDYPNAQKYHQSSRILWSSLGDAGRQGYALATSNLGFSLPVSEIEQSIVYIREALGLFQAAGYTWGEAEATFHLGVACIQKNNWAQGKLLFDQALALFRKVGDRRYQGFVNNNLVQYFLFHGQVAEAEKHNQEMLRCFRELDLIHGLNHATENQGILLMRQGFYAEAENAFRQSIALAQQSGVQYLIASAYRRISQVKLYQNQPQDAFTAALLGIHILNVENNEYWIAWYNLLNLAAAVANQNILHAARLHGKALFELQQLGEEPYAQDIHPADEILNRARMSLGEKQYSTAQSEGAAMSLDALLSGLADLDFSLQAIPPSPPAPSLTVLKARKARFSGLTTREREVAVFIVQGLSNPAIASRMTLSERTVTTHVSNILTKLGYTSRTQIAAWAVEKGLVSPSADDFLR